MFAILLASCYCDCKKQYTTADEIKTAAMLNPLNTAEAQADFSRYFSFYADDAVFIGTDATERWDKKSFMEWSQPYFDRGKARSFTVVQRNILFDKSGELAWFDELLSTQMKICRGSGVVAKEGDPWKIKQYVLSMTIPNSAVVPSFPFRAHKKIRCLKHGANPSQINNSRHTYVAGYLIRTPNSPLNTIFAIPNKSSLFTHEA